MSGLCPNCEANDTESWIDNGDSGFTCKVCGYTVENNVLVKEGGGGAMRGMG